MLPSQPITPGEDVIAQQAPAVAQRVCAECGEAFEPTRKGGVRQRYCGAPCRQRAAVQRRANRRAPAPEAVGSLPGDDDPGPGENVVARPSPDGDRVERPLWVRPPDSEQSDPAFLQLDDFGCGRYRASSDPSRCRSELADRRLALQRLQLLLQLSDRSGDLGRAAVLDRAAAVGHARDRAVALRLERLEARLHLRDRRRVSPAVLVR